MVDVFCEDTKSKKKVYNMCMFTRANMYYGHNILWYFYLSYVANLSIVIGHISLPYHC